MKINIRHAYYVKDFFSTNVASKYSYKNENYLSKVSVYIEYGGWKWAEKFEICLLIYLACIWIACKLVKYKVVNYVLFR